MTDNPLFSIVVLIYNNQRYVYELLDSIFFQDYDNIQLIVSDDGSKEFDFKKLSDYIESYKKSNIKDVIINHNKNNLGTVKHVELMLEKSSGEYVMYIAADDVLFDQNSISTLVNGFNDKNDCIQVVTSLVGMYDDSLERFDHFFNTKDEIDLINSGDSWKLFETLSLRCIIAAPGTVYHRDVFKKIGPLSKDYFLIEDWISYLRIARMGIKIKYIESITAKHRDGGISHGNKRNNTDAYRRYCKDFVTAFELEIMPYAYKMNSIKIEKLKRIRDSHNNTYKNLDFEYNRAKRLGISIDQLRSLINIKNICIQFCTSHKITNNLLFAISLFAIQIIKHHNSALFANLHFINGTTFFYFGLFFMTLAFFRLIINIMLNFWTLYKYGSLKD